MDMILELLRELKG